MSPRNLALATTFSLHAIAFLTAFQLFYKKAKKRQQLAKEKRRKQLEILKPGKNTAESVKRKLYREKPLDSKALKPTKKVSVPSHSEPNSPRISFEQEEKESLFSPKQTPQHPNEEPLGKILGRIRGNTPGSIQTNDTIYDPNIIHEPKEDPENDSNDEFLLTTDNPI